VQDVDLAARWFRTIYEEFEIFPLGRRKRNSESGTLTLKSDAKDQVDGLASRVGVHLSNCWKSTCHVQFHAHNFSPLMSNKSCPLYPKADTGMTGFSSNLTERRTRVSATWAAVPWQVRGFASQIAQWEARGFVARRALQFV